MWGGVSVVTTTRVGRGAAVGLRLPRGNRGGRPPPRLEDHRRVLVKAPDE